MTPWEWAHLPSGSTNSTTVVLFLMFLVLLLHPHYKGQNNTSFLTGAHNAGAKADNMKNNGFSYMTHICDAASDIFFLRRDQGSLQLGSADRIAKVSHKKIEDFHFPSFQLLPSVRLGIQSMLCKPTFHCCIVGFDIFKQPASVDLRAGRKEKSSIQWHPVTVGQYKKIVLHHFLDISVLQLDCRLLVCCETLSASVCLTSQLLAVSPQLGA